MSTQSYMIAKYVDDIRRNEPINVGVIVFEGSTMKARFEGEDESDRLDRRRIRRLVSGRDAYAAWVAHWRRLVDKAENADDLLAAGSPDFFIEPGGDIILDLDQPTLSDTLRDLYARLVRPEDAPAPKTLQEKSQHALRLAGVDLGDDQRFRSDPKVTVQVQGKVFEETFSYSVRNGTWHYLQEISLDSQRPRWSRKEANHCAFLLEHARIEGGRRVVLFDGTDINETTEPMLDLVSGFAPVVDVDDSERAAESLEAEIGLAA